MRATTAMLGEKMPIKMVIQWGRPAVFTFDAGTGARFGAEPDAGCGAPSREVLAAGP